MNIPEGFGTITPYYSVSSADGFLAFMTAAFGAHEVGRTVDEHGRVIHMQIRVGTTTAMVSEANEQYPSTTANYYIFVENADDTIAKAVAAGATSIMDVFDMPYGDRQGGITDPFGNTWWVSQRLVAEGYEF